MAASLTSFCAWPRPLVSWAIDERQFNRVISRLTALGSLCIVSRCAGGRGDHSLKTSAHPLICRPAGGGGRLRAAVPAPVQQITVCV